MRIILYLGKGGVGKTTVSAATAVCSAQQGKRTLAVSTDLAHSLADCLQTNLTSTPREITKNLWAQEVNVLDEMRQGWGKLQESMTKSLRSKVLMQLSLRNSRLSLAWMKLLASSISIAMHVKVTSMWWSSMQLLQVRPVRLLSMPDTFQWYASRLMKMQSGALNLARPLLKAVLPTAEILDAVQSLSERVKTLRDVLSNPDISSYRPVVNPDAWSSKRLYAQNLSCSLRLSD